MKLVSVTCLFVLGFGCLAHLFVSVGCLFVLVACLFVLIVCLNMVVCLGQLFVLFVT